MDEPTTFGFGCQAGKGHGWMSGELVDVSPSSIGLGPRFPSLRCIPRLLPRVSHVIEELYVPSRHL